MLISKAKLQDELESEVKQKYLKMVSLGGRPESQEAKSSLEQFFERDEKATFYEKNNK